MRKSMFYLCCFVFVLSILTGCTGKEAAEKNAKEIDDAGYSIAIVNGRYLSSYGADNKDGEVKNILAALLNGEPAKSK